MMTIGMIINSGLNILAKGYKIFEAVLSSNS